MSDTAKYDALNATARAVALYLPGYGLTQSASYEGSRYAILTHLEQEGNELSIHYLNNETKRLEIGTWTHNFKKLDPDADDALRYATMRANPITVSAEREAASIARDVQCKLLPNHNDAYIANVATIDQHRMYKRQLRETIALAQAAFPIPPAWAASPRTDAPNMDKWSCNSPRVGSVKCGTSYVHLEITLQPSECAEVAAFIAKLAKRNDK